MFFTLNIVSDIMFLSSLNLSSINAVNYDPKKFYSKGQSLAPNVLIELLC